MSTPPRYNSNETELFYLIRKCRNCEGPDLENTIKQIRELLKKVEINYQDSEGDTFLHAAIVENIPDVANLLLEKGIDFNISNKKGETSHQLAKEKYSSLDRWSEIITKLEELSKADQSKDPLSPDGQQVLEDSNSKFISKTLDDKNYEICLEQEDIANIAKTTYGWHGENGNVVFEVIGSSMQLGKQLEQYKDKLKEPNKQSLTFIVSLNNLHWVTLVITYQNQQFSAYYIDSLASGIPNGISNALREKIADIDIRSFNIQQQSDRYNCGIFALENAKIINDALQNARYGQVERLLDYKLTEEQLRDKRIEFATELLTEVRGEFIDIIKNREHKEKEKLEKLEKLFEAYPELNVNFPVAKTNLDTLLHIAVRRKESKIVKFLMKKGASIHALGKNGNTPMDIAQHNMDVAQHNNEQSIVLMLQQPVFYKEVDVPGDGNCLFWSVALAYLTPVKFDDGAFRERFQKLFASDNDIQAIQKLIQGNTDIYKDNRLRRLVTEVFRGRVIDKISSHQKELENKIGMIDFLESRNEDYLTEGAFKERFNSEFNAEEVKQYGIDISKLQPNFFNRDAVEKIGAELSKIQNRSKVRRFRFTAYLECMRNTQAWGGKYEIIAMSELLNTAITVSQEDSRDDKYNEKKKYYSEIHLLYKKINHYQFYQVEYSNLIKFVQSFVQSFEMKLIVYSTFEKTVRQGNRILREGIIIDGIVRSVFGFSAHKGIGKRHRAPLKTGNIVQAEKDFLSLSDLIKTFNKYKLGFRKILVDAGCDIFQSFEVQFGKIGFDQVSKVADDIVDKIIKYYINKEYEKSLDGAKIVEALVLDKYLQEIPEVRYGKENYNIRDLYENVGIAREKGGSFTYYRRNVQQKDKSSQYGYRRLFIGEKLRTIYTDDTKAETTNAKFTGYVYASDQENFRDTVEKVFSIVNKEIQTPSKERIWGFVEKVKFHIEQEVESLSQQISSYHQQHKQSVDKRKQALTERAEELSKEEDMRKSKELLKKAKKNKDTISLMRTNLKKLPDLDYCLKLERMFVRRAETISQDRNKLSESQRADTAKPKETWSFVKELTTKLGKLNFNDVYPPVEEFTGRAQQIHDIYEKLYQKEGEGAVISNQAGIGKTQLARKYASANKESYLYIYEANTEDMLLIESSFASFVRNKLAMSMKEKKSLIGKKKSLFIFHDARKEDVEKVLRIRDENRGGFYLLLTSDQDLENVAKVKLTTLMSGEAEELAKKILGITNESQDEQIKALVEKLKGFPLAIKQAAAYIRNKRLDNSREALGISEYLRKYEDFDQRPSQNTEQGEYDKVLLVTSQISIEAIQEVNSREEVSRILNAMAYFGSSQIDPGLFFPWIKDKDKLGSVFELLERYSMINAEEREGYKMYIMHESVKKTIRSQLNIDEAKQVLTHAINLMCETEGEDFNKRDISHFMSLFNHSRGYGSLVEENGRFVHIVLGVLNIPYASS